MKIYIGADHRGFQMKEQIKSWLATQNVQVEDMGNDRLDPQDDYVDFARPVAEKVSTATDTDTRGILVCGSGIGVSMTANKFSNIRCGLGFDEEQVEDGRNHDDINILALASDQTDFEKAKRLIAIFLHTPFAKDEKYRRRIEKIQQVEHISLSK